MFTIVLGFLLSTSSVYADANLCTDQDRVIVSCTVPENPIQQTLTEVRLYCKKGTLRVDFKTVRDGQASIPPFKVVEHTDRETVAGYVDVYRQIVEELRLPAEFKGYGAVASLRTFALNENVDFPLNFVEWKDAANATLGWAVQEVGFVQPCNR